MTSSNTVVPVRGTADLIVVGSGAAGMATALHASGRRVLLLTADALGVGSASSYAAGGIAAAVGADDSPTAHALDTLAVGWGANDPAVVDMLTGAAPRTIEWLTGLGTRFERGAQGWVLGREAGHRHARILHANGDATGREITRALSAAVADAPHIDVQAGTEVVSLLTEGGRVAGVVARVPTVATVPQHPGDGHDPCELVAYTAGAVVLATGGSAGAWRDTTNPPWSRGSGLVLAADAGAELADLQYVQFHPTALACDADPLPLLTEALRGAGASVVDGRGRRFLTDEHPDAELAPRDVVARAIARRRATGSTVRLDMRPIADLAERFPSAVAACRRHGIEPLREPVPITPAAHYHMGGIAVDQRGRSSLPGLYAAGEAACTGAHGANRLASNSLLEALVFGERVAGAVAPDARTPAFETHHGDHANVVTPIDPALLVPSDPRAVDAVRALLSTHVGVERTSAGLREACNVLDGPTGRRGGALAAVARMVVAAALAHSERRGAHWRTDAVDAAVAAPRVIVTAPGRTQPVAAVRPARPEALTVVG